MNLQKAVKSIGTITELKRIAKAYVIDYRNLDEDEIREALIKTGPQYYYENNVSSTLRAFTLSSTRHHRIISHLLLRRVLLQKDGYVCPRKETDDGIIEFEQDIVNLSNEELLDRSDERNEAFELFKFVLETAWGHNDDVSPDEKNLIEKLRDRLQITEREYYQIEAKLGKFPKPGNTLHTRGEIEDVRQLMQAQGLLFSIRDDDNTDFDVIPDEIAEVLRKLLGIGIRDFGYTELLKSKHVRSKKHLIEILKKGSVPIHKNPTVEELKFTIQEHVPPEILLGGYSPRDGLNISTLEAWCSDLGLPISGSKNERIDRIVQHFDALQLRDESVGDEREFWFNFFEKLAERDLTYLRSQQVIDKDLQCERRFEEATNFLFEKRLYHKPLNLVGSAHADGALSFQDKLIFWDNKSKESQVNLKDHIKQFDGYIKSADKPVAGFFVIGPCFTPESSLLAMEYQVQNGVPVTMITANELKQIADGWMTKSKSSQEKAFPLGYLLQPGRLNLALLEGVL